jgi:hypothetical protein
MGLRNPVEANGYNFGSSGELECLRENQQFSPQQFFIRVSSPFLLHIMMYT